MKALVYVTLKPEVLDPQGKAIQRACETLGYGQVEQVRQGKLFEIELSGEPSGDTAALLAELSEKLLSNPVIEDYRLVDLG